MSWQVCEFQMMGMCAERAGPSGIHIHTQTQTQSGENRHSHGHDSIKLLSVSTCDVFFPPTGLISQAHLQMKITSYGEINNGTITKLVQQVWKI